MEAVSSRDSLFLFGRDARALRYGALGICAFVIAKELNSKNWVKTKAYGHKQGCF